MLTRFRFHFLEGKIEDQLGTIFIYYKNQLIDLAEQSTKNREDAEDIVQNTFLTVIELSKKLEFSNHSNLQRYLYKLVRSRCVDFYRKKKRLLQQVTDRKLLSLLNKDETGQKIKSEIILNKIHQEIENLPPECKKIIKLTLIEELPHEQVAAILGISIFTVRNHKVRGRKLLKEKLLLSLTY